MGQGGGGGGEERGRAAVRAKFKASHLPLTGALMAEVTFTASPGPVGRLMEGQGVEVMNGGRWKEYEKGRRKRIRG